MHPISEITRNILRTDGRPGGEPHGKIHLELEDIYGSHQPKTIRVDLYNYGIDGNLPRPEHKQWIQAQLLPFLRAYRYHVKLYGRASRSGGELVNYRVSRQRVLLLKEYLVVECGLSEAQVPGSQMQHHGDQLASRSDHESERDRCVQMVLSPGWKTRPMPKPKVRIAVQEVPRSTRPEDWNTDPEPYEPIHVPGHLFPDKAFFARRWRVLTAHSDWRWLSAVAESGIRSPVDSNRLSLLTAKSA